jgi:fermentation-respiration switch protein FrsA (DUF1100 family)
MFALTLNLLDAPVKETMSSLAISVALGLLLLNGLMYFQQKSMIFYPMEQLVQTPAQWGLGYEDVFLDTADNVRLHGWFIPNPQSDRVLLFFHGNAGNISHRRDSIEIFYRLGLNVFIIDYRGYGESDGSPGEQGMYKDADAAWRYLTEDRGYAPEQILIFGRSLGGAVAAKLASEVQARGLILESTLSSARDFARAVFTLLSRLVVLRYTFDTVAYVQRVHDPVLVLHSPEDEIMPFHLGEKVFQNANQPKHFIRMRGDHNNGFILSQPEYEQQLDAWLQAL